MHNTFLINGPLRQCGSRNVVLSEDRAGLFLARWSNLAVWPWEQATFGVCLALPEGMSTDPSKDEIRAWLHSSPTR
jgi:hypothetical protein